MLIVLDPGHTDKVNQGGHPSYYEGTEMYYFSHILKDILQALGHTVSITRSGLYDNPSLEQRGRSAKGADLFLSLHSDYAGLKNQVIIFDDMNPNYANPGLAKSFSYSLSKFWDCEGKVIYRSYDDTWHTAPKKGASNYFGVLRSSYAKSNMLLEIFNHRCAKASEQFLKQDIKISIAKLLATVIQTHYQLPENAGDIRLPAKYRVVSGSYAEREGAILRVKQLQKAGFDAWILPI